MSSVRPQHVVAHRIYPSLKHSLKASMAPSDRSNASGTRLDDQHLAKLLESELLLDDRVSSSNIQVTVEDGVVTLRGTIGSFRRKLVSQQIAASYEGVRDVVNRLEVDPGSACDDNSITANVRRCIDSSADLTSATIGISVSQGKTTLTGHVSSHWERLVAEDVVRGVRGVRDVINLLVVDQEHHIEDHEMRNSIQAALSRARGLENAEMRVAIADDTVVLSGWVDEIWHKDIAQTTVGRFGFLRIRNELQVRHP